MGVGMDDIVDKYFASVNSEDWELMARLWHADARIDAVGFRAPIVGRDAIVAYFPKVLAGYSEHVDTPTRTLAAGNTRVVEIHFEGRLHNGVDVRFEALDVFDFTDGLISRLSTWYDTKRVARLVRGR